uniref:Telomere length regulation protein conserved domain-containing protein n=1 Tax=Bionectria ochroleuca TaxID=29856 RepID=A0A8H7N9K8_BIOOC
MDELLTPISTTYLKPKAAEAPLLTEVTSQNKQITPAALAAGKITSPDEALDTLKNQPSYDALLATLEFLTNSEGSKNSDFSLHIPSPKSAAIVKILVTEIAHNYWPLFSASGDGDTNDTLRPKGAFVSCLSSVTGVNAILSHMVALVNEVKSSSKGISRSDLTLHLEIFLDLLSTILSGDHAAQHLWTTSTKELTNDILKKGQTQTFVSLLTNGRIVSVAAEALTLVGEGQLRNIPRWTADGLEYTLWLGRNTIRWAKLESSDTEMQICSDLVLRGASLGYGERLFKFAIDDILLTKGADPNIFIKLLLNQLQAARKVLHILLDHLSNRFLDRLQPEDPSATSIISAAAGVIDSVIQGDRVRESHLIKWCSSSSGAGLGHGVGIRRAVLAALSKNKESIRTVLEKSVSQFGDELYIKHAAILQQNVHTEILLLSAGYVSRSLPIKLAMLLRSAPYLRAISNRIAAAQSRARFLGMVVGETLSGLVDSSDKKLDFHMDDMGFTDMESLKDLSKISDSIGSAEPLLSTRQHPPPQLQPTTTSKKMPKKKAKPASPTVQPKSIIQEIDSSGEEDEDEDLVPYAKHSDPEDSDDDPTLIQRNRVKPPVYIRDLIAFLRDSESYDKQNLALQTAPSLIRRKANYGAEVSSHADELAGLLVGLQDKFDIEKFHDLRQQSMIALIVSQPKTMAPWFARTYFEGDYSLAQRTEIIVALGLSSRELAGYDISQYQSSASFPSKKLPEKIEQLYISEVKAEDHSPASRLKPLPPTALDNIATSVTSAFLEPLAAEAADTATGPDVLKLQTFTARYKSKSAKRPRVRAIPNTTAGLLASSFFSPLTAHFSVALHSRRPMILNPALLGLYLQTLGIIVHAAGPSTLSLPQLTSELWSLLLGTRQHVVGDLGALKGWFVAMAALIEVNEGDMRRLCQELGREVVETREWASGVFERTRGEDGGDENHVKMLAAGVLIRLGEAIEKYQALLMGDLIGYT